MEREKDFSIDHFSGYRHGMVDYHCHEHYEISLVYSGSVHALFSDNAFHCSENMLILSPPKALHRIFNEPGELYARSNVNFHESFLSEFFPRQRHLLSSFGRHGRVVPLSVSQGGEYRQLVELLDSEKDTLRQKLLLMLYLSKISGHVEMLEPQAELQPDFIGKAADYIQENYTKRLTASQLAWELGVGRTTLMTALRKYTGSTFHQLLTHRRLQAALELLEKGETEQSAAEKCGFGDACNLIRSFKGNFGLTPKQYLITYKGE